MGWRSSLAKNYKEAFEKVQAAKQIDVGDYKGKVRKDLCRDFIRNGCCRFGNRCHWEHPDDAVPRSVLKSDNDMPDCEWWCKGDCREFPNCVRGKHDKAKYGRWWTSSVE